MPRRSWLQALSESVSRAASLLTDFRVIGIAILGTTTYLSGAFRHAQTDTSERTFFQTDVGEHQPEPAMSDGSRVILNTNTQVSIDYSSQLRVARMKGEALYEIVHNAQRPFLVCVDDTLSVVDLGTSFSVKQQSATRVVVTVSEGSALIEGGASINPVCGGKSPSSAVPQNPLVTGTAREAFSLQVLAGDQAELTIADGKISAQVTPLGRARVDAFHAWRSGVISIDDQPLQEALDELSRYGHKRFIAVPSIANRRIDGTLRPTSPEAVVKALTGSHGFVRVPPPKGWDPNPDIIYIGPDPKTSHRNR